MRKTGMRLALLAGCNRDNPYDYGRLWSLTAQEDYYPEQDQVEDEVSREYSNLGTSATAFETTEQERGTGGAGEAAFSLAPEPREGGTGGPGLDEQDEVTTRIEGSAQEQEHLWLQQDARTPYPPPPTRIPLGTGKPLRAGPNGAWIQGTYAVELGARAGQPGGLNPFGGPGSVAPATTPQGSDVAPPQQPANTGGQQAPEGQAGQPPDTGGQ